MTDDQQELPASQELPLDLPALDQTGGAVDPGSVGQAPLVPAAAPDTTLLSDAAVAEALEKSPAPRVTKEQIEAKIADVYYFQGPQEGTTTYCVIKMQNGFTFTGTSACVNPANFNREIGQKCAYEKAFDQIWSYEGYLLAEKGA